MHLADLSIKQPVFILCITVLLLATGAFFSRKLGVDLMPNVNFPFVMVRTIYPGAGPKEVESQVTQILEDEISGIQGVRKLRSESHEGFSLLVIEFDMDSDLKYDLQLVRDRVGLVRPKLPTEVREPTIQAYNPGDTPILLIALRGALPQSELFDLANEVVKPRLEQVKQVAQIDILGGRKREILVELDREKLGEREVSALEVSRQLHNVGKNIPVGKKTDREEKTVYRALGEFRTLADIQNTVVRLAGNEIPLTLGQVGRVVDTLEEEKNRSFVSGEPALLFSIYRQSGANTVEVAHSVTRRLAEVNDALKGRPGSPQLTLVRDGGRPIRANVADVNESIFFGIVLTVLVVWFFLGSARATFITGLALPTSLLGAFILMYAMGFSVNMLTMLALSLTVGLLIDDAIVVRENIFRHVELGHPPREASLLGTKQVTLAVTATTLTVLAVFGPIAFMQGLVGRYFKEFGLTICFAMAISLFDSLTIAPMLSAFLIGPAKEALATRNPVRLLGRAIARFSEASQAALERGYARVLDFAVRMPGAIIGASVLIFILSLYVAWAWVPKTFIPAQDSGEFPVTVELPERASLDATGRLCAEIDRKIRAHPEVSMTVLTVGNVHGEANKGHFFVSLVPRKGRTMATGAFKEILRQELRPYAWARLQVRDEDPLGSGQHPFLISVMGEDYAKVRASALRLRDRLRTHPALKDVDAGISDGSPEYQVVLDKAMTRALGVSSDVVGMELRAQIEGAVPAVFRSEGKEYDIRVRVREDQRDLGADFSRIRIPNMNGTLVPLSRIASPVAGQGVATIHRENRTRYVMVMSDLAADGPGLGVASSEAIGLLDGSLEGGKYRADPGVTWSLAGQTTYYKELMSSMVLALGLGVLFIFLVLSSLYRSFVTPLTIMVVLPLAVSGGFLALGIFGKSLDIFSMIGGILLIGVATKNSILLVDRAVQLLAEGKSRAEAIREAGLARLRPILMTSIALIAGMVPVAVGLTEASKQRTSMGILLIGGLVSSTLLSLVVIPAVFSPIDRLREWSSALIGRLSSPKGRGA
ncbi:MAG: efflux RND transporter permease subunit [Spirochaetes bacterium]|nr:efflux RND transporter permease subunit [Spirochaetota bacterium]